MENVGEITKLTVAKTQSTSLRTTVPMSIVRQFDLKPGDKIGWKLEVRNNEMIITVKPIRSERK